MLVEVHPRAKRQSAISMQTDKFGYAAFEVPPGIYDVTASSGGFRTVKVKKVRVVAGQRQLVRLILKVASTTITIQ